MYTWSFKMMSQGGKLDCATASACKFYTVWIMRLRFYMLTRKRWTWNIEISLKFLFLPNTEVWANSEIYFKMKKVWEKLEEVTDQLPILSFYQQKSNMFMHFYLINHPTFIWYPHEKDTTSTRPTSPANFVLIPIPKLSFY